MVTSYEKKIAIDSYLEFTKEVLSSWVKDAETVLNVSVASSLHSLTGRKLKKINTAVERIKEDVKDLFDAYKELEKEYELSPISVEYHLGLLEHREEIKKLLEKIRDIVGDYQFFVEKSKEEKIQIDTYITPINQKSIELLMNIYEEDLIKIIESGHLLGL